MIIFLQVSDDGRNRLRMDSQTRVERKNKTNQRPAFWDMPAQLQPIKNEKKKDIYTNTYTDKEVKEWNEKLNCGF